MSMRPDDHRRKWDKDEFEKIAAERLQAELDEDEKSKKKGRTRYHNQRKNYHRLLLVVLILFFL